jgi:molecular chaperone GrpE
MTGKQQKEADISLEEVIEEVEDQLAKDGVSAETDTEESTSEITIESLSEQIEALKKTAADNLDKAVRAQAELDNVRKRTTRDVENAHKYALDKFINELLPVLDSMELGLVASVEGGDVSSLREGLELTLKMFCSSLEKSGVHPVNPQKGDKFNPDQHEAVTMQEVDDVESGTVVTMLQKGYELNGRLIRPAMVIVAK